MAHGDAGSALFDSAVIRSAVFIADPSRQTTHRAGEC